MNDIYVVVPARAGSKGLIGKNRRKLGGKPLYMWSVDAAKAAGIDAVVSTDDPLIIHECKKKNIAYIERPTRFASDTSLDNDFLLHFIDYFKIPNKSNKHIINLRPTSPLRSNRDIKNFFDMVSRSDYSIRSVGEAPFTPFKMWFKDENSMLTQVVKHDEFSEPFNMPRQKLPQAFSQTGAFDSYVVSDIISGKINGTAIKAFEAAYPTIDIDSFDDLKRARKILSFNKNLYTYHE